MHTRQLFLIGYDIRENQRRRRVLRDVLGHALGGQKSFYECWLSQTEMKSLMDQLDQHIDPITDRVIFIRLDSRTKSICFGKAQPIDTGSHFFIL